MMKEFNLRSSFWNISGVGECECWIREVVDGKDVDRVRVMLWRPNINSMSNKRSCKIGQKETRCPLSLPIVRLSKYVLFKRVRVNGVNIPQDSQQ